MRRGSVLCLALVSACAGDPVGAADEDGTTQTTAPAETTTPGGTTGSDGDASSDATPGSEAGTTEPSPGSTSEAETTGGPPETTTGAVPEGTVRVLTYNVAGLPDVISGSNPAANTPLISPLLNLFELVLVQEDFSYHPQLAASAKHPYQSDPGGTGTLGDGLNRFSNSPFEDFVRDAWDECNGLFDSGSDCLTDKGFSVGLHELSPGVEVDVYNLHMDAGGSGADIAARQAQVQELLGTIQTRSVGRALIVAGDTNMDEEDEDQLVTLLTGAGLVDACRELACGEEYRIDRIMYRSSESVELTAVAWWVDEAFVNGEGEPLSDHEAVAADLDWALR